MVLLSRSFLAVPPWVSILARVLGIGFVLGATVAPHWQAPAVAIPGNGRGIMLLSYPPRIVMLALAMFFALEGLFRWLRAERSQRGRWSLQGVLMLAAACALVPQLDWGAGRRPTPPHGLTVLAYNVHHNGAGAERLAAVADARGVDILSLQEIREGERPAFVEALANYRLFWAEKNAPIEHWNVGPVSSVIAIAKNLLGDDEVVVETAITGYRTFAVRAQLAGTPLWVVNVHTTKAFWSVSDPVALLTRAGYKANWHAFEREHLVSWLKGRVGVPVLLAGDFNAPGGTYALDLPGTTRAHAVAGEGWHRTAPAALPMWGIDHILGAGPLEFYSYETLDLGLSDHLAQLATFSVARPGSGLASHDSLF